MFDIVETQAILFPQSVIAKMFFKTIPETKYFHGTN
jgi:hypothetical protein